MALSEPPTHRAETGTLGEAIVAFLGDAAEGRALDVTGDPYSPERIREVRGALAHVEVSLGETQVSALRARDLNAFLQRLDDDGISPRRRAEITDALRALDRYVHQLDGDGGGVSRPNPTDAMLALGAQLGAWFLKLVVLAFALIVFGLLVALLI